MNQLLNNAFFWQKLDTLLFTLDYQKVRDIGDVHPDYSNLVYPLEYGYLKDPDNNEKVVAKVFRGSLKQRHTDQVILCVDILQKELDVKILLGCNEQEQRAALEFLNQTAFQKTVLIRRGDETPDWAMDQ